MDFRLTAEQTGFAQSLTDLMSRADSVAAARAWGAGEHKPGLALWHRLAEQGVNALMVPEEHGGMGASVVDLVVAFEVLGHQLAVGPWIEAAAYLPAALPAERLPDLAAGALATVAVPPHVPLALDADVADRVYAVVDGRFTEAAAGVVHLSVDTTRRLCQVDVGAALVATDLGRAFELAALACAAELMGCGERMLADSVAYAEQRSQYGRVIGSFQALKHQLADVRIALDFARPLVHGAAVALDSGPKAERLVSAPPLSVSAAKVAAGDAAYLASRVALQVHGAIGYTAELDLGLWIARVRALVGAWGTTGWHRDRIADHLRAGQGAA